MDEIRSSPARRLSQILDPIARLTASDFGSSSSAPCSPRLGARVHDTCVGPTAEAGRGPSSPEASRSQSNVADASRAGPDSPRLLPRRGRQGPTPPPRPRNNNSPLPYRDSPYVNVANLIFQKDKSFAESAKNAGYVELKDSTIGASNTKSKCSPYNFTSESSGHVEYTDKRTFAAQTDFGLTCFENKAHDIQNQVQVLCSRGRSSLEPGTSGRSNFERSYSLSGRQQDAQGRLFHGDAGRLSDRGPSTIAAREQEAKNKESRPAYGSSKSFDGYTSSVEELNWQERCLELQLELHRSRSQATRVRDMLREKVSVRIIWSILMLS